MGDVGKPGMFFLSSVDKGSFFKEHIPSIYPTRHLYGSKFQSHVYEFYFCLTLHTHRYRGSIKMSPKRKETGQGDDPPKAKKTRSKDTPDDDATKTDVNWFIPKERGKNVYKENCATDFAQNLYEKARDEIRPQQTPLSDPQFRTPVFQKKGKDLRVGDNYRPSASLRDLFNNIKSRSSQKEEGRSITNFQQQFDGKPNIALVLSRAENSAILALDEDQRLEV